MTDEPEPADLTNHSGGADLNAQGEIHVEGDVVGRDKFTHEVKVDTGGGAIIGGNVSANGGEIILRDKNVNSQTGLVILVVFAISVIAIAGLIIIYALARSPAVPMSPEMPTAMATLPPTPTAVASPSSSQTLASPAAPTLIPEPTMSAANSPGSTSAAAATNALTTTCQTNLICNFNNDEPCPDTIKFPAPRLTSRIYISMTQRGEDDDWGYSLWEVQAFNGTNNISLQGGIPRASSSQAVTVNGCTGAVCAMDNKPDTRWSSNWKSSDVLPQAWFEISLPSPVSIDHVTLEWQKAYAQKYCVTIE